jgi:hypothetical protein
MQNVILPSVICPSVVAPSNWSNFDISAIADQVQKLIKTTHFNKTFFASKNANFDANLERCDAHNSVNYSAVSFIHLGFGLF